MPPPLEDMSAKLDQVRKLRDARSGLQGRSTSSVNKTQAVSQNAEQTPGQHLSTPVSQTKGLFLLYPFQVMVMIQDPINRKKVV